MRISDWSSDVCSSDLWAAQYYGWRAAFILVGLPGFLLALATKFLLREPRLQAGFAVTPEKTEPVRQGIRLLFAKPAHRTIVYALILYFLMPYGPRLFMASFLLRVHGLTVPQPRPSAVVMSAVPPVTVSPARGKVT